MYRIKYIIYSLQCHLNNQFHTDLIKHVLGVQRSTYHIIELRHEQTNNVDSDKVCHKPGFTATGDD